MMISVAHLTRIYPGAVPITALNDVSFDIKRGELIAIIGRSGSGKSTLLHQIGLIDTPSRGTIQIDGVNILELSDQQKSDFRLSSIGFIFQEYALIPELTALENVLLPAMAKGQQSKTQQRATELLNRVGLGNRLHHYPNELSGGEQQRVAIARALINEPKILLADEPTANLDSVSARVILKLFRQLNQELQQTILMITHEPEDKEFVDRILWLSDGKLQETDIPTDAAGMRRILSVAQTKTKH